MFHLMLGPCIIKDTCVSFVVQEYISIYTSWNWSDMVMITYDSGLLEKYNHSYYGEREGEKTDI